MDKKAKNIRQYLTSEEIAFISNKMINTNSVFERTMIKWGLIGQFLYDFEGVLDITDETSTNDIYNCMVENNIDIYFDIHNIDDLDQIVNAEFSVSKTVEKVLNGVIEKLNESTKDIDPKALMVELNKLKAINNGN